MTSIEETGVLGKLTSVTLVRTADFGDTTFTLLVAEVNLLGSASHFIHTVGITTMHRTTIAGLGHGQLTTYHVTRLHGSAAQVHSDYFYLVSWAAMLVLRCRRPLEAHMTVATLSAQQLAQTPISYRKDVPMLRAPSWPR